MKCTICIMLLILCISSLLQAQQFTQAEEDSMVYVILPFSQWKTISDEFGETPSRCKIEGLPGGQILVYMPYTMYIKILTYCSTEEMLFLLDLQERLDLAKQALMIEDSVLSHKNREKKRQEDSLDVLRTVIFSDENEKVKCPFCRNVLKEFNLSIRSYMTDENFAKNLPYGVLVWCLNCKREIRVKYSPEKRGN